MSTGKSAKTTLVRRHGVFYIRTRSGSEDSVKSTGTRDRREALKILREGPASSTPSILDFSRSYKTYLEQASKSPKTVKLSMRGLGLLAEYSSDKKLELLTKSDLCGWADWMRGREMAEMTVSCYWRAVKRALSIAGDWYPLRPLTGVKWKSKGRAVPVVMDGEQVNKLLDAIQIPYFKDLVSLVLMTGMRRGEVLSLKWADVDLERRNRDNEPAPMITLYGTKSGDNYQEIPLSREAVEILARQPHRGAYVFCSRSGGRLYDHQVSRTFKRQVIKAGLNSAIHFHTLRHTCATLLLRCGVSIYDVSRILRHTSVKTTELYVHILSSELHGSVNKLQILHRSKVA